MNNAPTRFLLAAVLLLAACTKYSYENLPERSEPATVNKHFTPAHTEYEQRSRQVREFEQRTWPRTGRTRYRTEYYTVPVFHPDRYILSVNGTNTSWSMESSTQPVRWEEVFQGEQVIAYYTPVYRTPLDDKGIPHGERQFDHNQFLRFEKATAERR